MRNTVSDRSSSLATRARIYQSVVGLVLSGAFAPMASHAADSAATGILEEITVTARKLDTARDSIQASIGANDYRLTRAALDIQPGGADKPLSAVLLQAPGVTQDSDGDGEIHIRNEHANIQYRLNGVTVPDTIAGFGPLVDARVAESIELITGFSLFHRSATGAAPTAAGLVVLECAARVLHEVAALDRALAELDNNMIGRMPAHAALGSSGDFSVQGLSAAPRGL